MKNKKKIHPIVAYCFCFTFLCFMFSVLYMKQKVMFVGEWKKNCSMWKFMSVTVKYRSTYYSIKLKAYPFVTIIRKAYFKKVYIEDMMLIYLQWSNEV